MFCCEKTLYNSRPSQSSKQFAFDNLTEHIVGHYLLRSKSHSLGVACQGSVCPSKAANSCVCWCPASYDIILSNGWRVARSLLPHLQFLTVTWLCDGQPSLRGKNSHILLTVSDSHGDKL